jgi:HSP20 family protein
MTLVRWNPRAVARCSPAREMVGMTDTWNSLVDEFLGLSPATKCDWMPAADVREESDRYVVTVDLPGLAKDDVELSFENDVLTISGERKSELQKDEGRVHRSERYYGKFTRAMRFPGDVRHQDISASFTNGVLEVSLPKAEEARKRKIEVK